MKKTITILIFLSLLLTIWAAVLWLLPSAADTTNTNKTRYGLNEGLELVELNNGATGKRYVVEDANGNELKEASRRVEVYLYASEAMIKAANEGTLK